jgi:hypothetical protein
MWRVLIVLGVAFLLALARPVSRVERKTAAELALAFDEKPYEAIRKYVRRPVGGIDDYPRLQVRGRVKKVLQDGRGGVEVWLDTGLNNIELVLRGKAPLPSATPTEALGQGYVSRFDARTIVIDCQSLALGSPLDP